MNDIVKDNIFKSFGYANEEDFIENGMSTTDAIRKGMVEFDDELEKAVYADTYQNRKLGRVGQEYHRGKGKKQEEPMSRNDRNKKQEDGKVSEEKLNAYIDEANDLVLNIEDEPEKYRQFLIDTFGDDFKEQLEDDEDDEGLPMWEVAGDFINDLSEKNPTKFIKVVDKLRKISTGSKKSTTDKSDKESSGKPDGVSEKTMKFIRENTPKIGDTITVGFNNKKMKVKDVYVSHIPLKDGGEQVSINVLTSDRHAYVMHPSSNKFTSILGPNSLGSGYKKQKEQLKKKGNVLELDENGSWKRMK